MELGLATAVTPHFLGSDGGSIPYFGAAPRMVQLRSANRCGTAVNGCPIFSHEENTKLLGRVDFHLFEISGAK